MNKNNTDNMTTSEIMNSMEAKIFQQKEIMKLPNTKIAESLNICRQTVTNRTKTPTYERLREMALLALNEEFGGDVMRHWAKMVKKLSSAKRKDDSDYKSMQAAVQLMQSTLGLDAPKVEKVEHGFSQMDTDELDKALDEAIIEYELDEPSNPALAQATETDSEDKGQEETGQELDEEER